MTALILFLAKAVTISLSGVMAPGPVTAATIAAGTRSRHAGGLIAVGHGIVELPLVLCIWAGMGRLFLQSETVKMVIGFVGGAFLLFMGIQMLRSVGKNNEKVIQHTSQNPLWTGIILSAGNPFFLLWWPTVGLVLIKDVQEFGGLAFALFITTHWLCDLVWLEALSWTSFKGAKLLGGRTQYVVLLVCSLTLVSFGLFFIYNAIPKTVVV